MKKIILNHTPLRVLISARLDAIPIEKGFVIAAENPKQAERRQTPKPVIVSNPSESMKIIIKGKRVISSSKRPNKLPNNIKNKTQTQITSFCFFPNFETILFIITLMPFVLSKRLKIPLIINRNN